MTNNGLTKELLDKAVRVALQENSKSTMMFLLRERMAREIIESAIPIIVEPLMEIIDDLENQIEELKKSSQNSKQVPTTSPDLLQLKEAISEMVNIIDIKDI